MNFDVGKHTHADELAPVGIGVALGADPRPAAAGQFDQKGLSGGSRRPFADQRRAAGSVQRDHEVLCGADRARVSQDMVNIVLQPVVESDK